MIPVLIRKVESCFKKVQMCIFIPPLTTRNRKEQKAAAAASLSRARKMSILQESLKEKKS